ncbi:MAG: hypothetical protein AB8B51_03215 [Sedimentitalea sp.]
MTLVERLDLLREEFATCSVVAFADLSTSTVLGASAAANVPQEDLDSLCAVGIEMLDGGVARKMLRVLGQDSSQTLDHAIAVEGAQVGVFLRSNAERGDALCCLVATDADFDPFMTAARDCLDTICAQT